MNDKLGKALESIIPFLVVGVAIAVFFGLLFLFFYVALWGLLIGGALYLIALAKQYFFPSVPVKKERGRVIEHDDNK